MTDVETQASQRTVVAFISGLLIGGLLVWIFSSTPNEMRSSDEKNEDDAEMVEKDTNTSKTEDTTKSVTTTNTSTDGRALSVADQEAGASVTLERVAYPDESGWVVVREYINGAAGNILGAARYDIAMGLQPGSVTLVRSTVPGGTYEASFYTNEGALSFDLAEDKPVLGISATFKTK